MRNRKEKRKRRGIRYIYIRLRNARQNEWKTWPTRRQSGKEPSNGGQWGERERERKLMKIRDLSRHAPPRQAQTNRPEVNVRSFHESSFRQSHGAPSGPVDQLPLKALIKVLIRFPFPTKRGLIPVFGELSARQEFLLFVRGFPPLSSPGKNTGKGNGCLFPDLMRSRGINKWSGMDLDGCLEKLDRSYFRYSGFRVWMCYTVERESWEFSALEMHLKRDYSKFWENVTDWEQFIFSFIWSKWMRNVKWTGGGEMNTRWYIYGDYGV